MNKNNRSIMGMRRAATGSATGLMLAIALAGLAGGSAVAAEQAATPAKPAAEAAPFKKEALHQMSATVEAISMATREVTLKGKDGHVQTIKVGPEARNLDQVHVGDKVTVSYYESFTAQMRLRNKPNEGFQNAAGAVRAGAGEQPGGAAAQSVASTVTIDSVDLAANTVTFHRPDGVVSTLPIRSPEGRAFVSKLKKDDVVDVMYTEAVAVDVTKGPAAEKSK